MEKLEIRINGSVYRYRKVFAIVPKIRQTDFMGL